jgi:hypothetical protein
MWTTFKAKISAPAGQPSSEYCNAQQIAPKTLLTYAYKFPEIQKKVISQISKKQTLNELF